MASLSPGGIRYYRWKEFGLMIIPSLLLLLAMTQLLLANAEPQSTLNAKNLPTIHGLIPALGMIVVLLVANVIMSIFFRKADQVLLPLVGLLSGIGVLMATRLGPDLPRKLADPALGSKQLLYVLLGITLCIATIFLLRKLSWLSRYKYTWIALGFMTLIYSVINGIMTIHSAAPTHDYLFPGIGSHVQPSEILKICIVIFFAGYLSENHDMLAQGFLRIGKLRFPPLRQLGPLMLMLGLALIIFFVVRELGLALLIYGLFLTMTYLGSGKLRYTLAALALFVVLGFIGYLSLNYIRARFASVSFDYVHWQNWGTAQEDFLQKLGGGGQILAGLTALASGGLLGAGLGLGHPSFVPVVQSDMIFTALGEELGLAGVFAIIGIYLLIIYRGFRIAIEATDAFSQLLAAGLTSIFAIQTLIICAGNMNFIPFTGIPLPFLSAGGSSVVANFIIIGILLRISYNTKVEREGLA